jgi:hypothetical protein
MIPQAPINQPPQTQTTTNQVQSEQLDRADLQHTVKQAILKQLIRSSLSQNQAAQVRTGVSIVDLQTHQEIIGSEQDTKHFAASVNKVPIALLLLEDLRAGTLTLDQTVTWTAADFRGGFGSFDQPGAPLQAPLRDVIFDMLNMSGNTVVKASVNYVLGGAEAVNQRFAAKPELSNTSLTLLGGGAFFLGDSTPHDSLWALEQITSERDQYSKFMKNAMATNIFTDFGVRNELQNEDFMLLVNKIGLLDDPDGNNRHDVGIIYNKHTRRAYGYSFFTTTAFENTAGTERADQSLKDMGSAVLRYAGDKKRRAPRHLRRDPTERRRVRY